MDIRTIKLLETLSSLNTPERTLLLSSILVLRTGEDVVTYCDEVFRLLDEGFIVVVPKVTRLAALAEYLQTFKGPRIIYTQELEDHLCRRSAKLIEEYKVKRGV